MEKLLLIIGCVVIGLHLLQALLWLSIKITEWRYDKFTPEWEKQVDSGVIQFNGHNVIDQRLTIGENSLLVDGVKHEMVKHESRFKNPKTWRRSYYDAVIELIKNK